MSQGRSNTCGIRKQGGGGAIPLDRDGDLDMSNDNHASHHARSKGHARIRGWKQSKAGIDINKEQTAVFLSKQHRQRTKLTRRPDDLSSPMGTDPSLVARSPFNKDQMTAFLSKRYHQPTKLLDLSNLGTDPDLMAMGLFNNPSTEPNFFSVLMRVWDTSFESLEKSRAAVNSVTLANNWLADISPITTLSRTFPNLRHLDLSNNNFKDAQALTGWRWKFRQLELLDLSGTPFSSDHRFKDTMLKWYPKLKILNNIEVRTADELAAQSNKRAFQHARTKGQDRSRGWRQSKAGSDHIKDLMTAFLSKRYHQPTKLLDLSSLGTDPDFVAMGPFYNTLVIKTPSAKRTLSS
jgi:Leucine Rich repeats (2 copies)